MITNSTLATGSNVITLSMVQNPGGCGGGMPAPQWSYASPTPEMEAKGLEPSKLREILQQINDDSDKTLAENFNPNLSKLRFLPLILILIGIIISITTMGSGSFGIGMAVFGIGGFATVGAMWYVYSQYGQAVQTCVNNMKQHVEERLNEDWQKSNGIRWSVETTQVLETRGSHDNRRIRTRTLYHIQVTVVAPAVAMVQQVPMQQGVQMVMVPAGTAVPMQMPMQQGQVQYVAATVQAAPPQYQQEAPPQYEAGGAVTGNGNDEGPQIVYN